MHIQSSPYQDHSLTYLNAPGIILFPLVAWAAHALASFPASRDCNLLKPFDRLVESFESSLIVAKPGPMIDRAPRYKARRMLYVQHFVVEHILYDVSWDCDIIERAADYYCPMDVVVVTENPARLTLAPGEPRRFKLTVEVFNIQLREQFRQIVDLTARRSCDLVSAVASSGLRGIENRGVQSVGAINPLVHLGRL